MAVAVSSQLKQWADSVLQLVGVPVTPTNEDTLYRWARAESGSDPLRWNNPLNTTENWSGATAVNSVGVKSYPSLDVGARATAATLTNGYYPDILSALQNSLPTSQWGSAARAQVTKWGTNLAFLGGGGSGGGSSQLYTSPSSGASTIAYGARPGQLGYSGPAASSALTNPFDALGNAIQGAGVSIGSGVGGAIGSAEQSLARKLISVFEIAAGATMLLAGAVILVILVSRSEGGQAVRSAAGRVGRTAANFTPQGRAVNVARAAAPKQPELSPQAQAAVAAAKAGRGSKLSPEVKAELRGRKAE